NVPKRKNFTTLEKEEVIRHLLFSWHNKDGVLRRGVYKADGEEFGCVWKTIMRLWKKYDQQRLGKGRCGQKGVPIDELRPRLREIPLNDRTTTQCRLAAALGIPQPTLHRNLKALGLKAHSNALKP
ncbi:unnamed protein product, partial [Ectocarpus sp. 8 AP-2014]